MISLLEHLAGTVTKFRNNGEIGGRERKVRRQQFTGARRKADRTDHREGAWWGKGPKRLDSEHPLSLEAKPETAVDGIIEPSAQLP